MALAEFFGCLLLAFGPPLAMFVLTVAKDPIRVIIMITSAFFWLIALLCSGLVWYTIKTLPYNLEAALILSVFIQESFRYIFYLFIKKAEKGLRKAQSSVVSPSNNKEDMRLDSNSLAYVSGFGFGIINGAFSLVNLLGAMTGPGTVGLFGDSQYFYLVSSFITLCFILLHTSWSVSLYLSLAMYPLKSIQMAISFVVVVGSHLFVSCLSLVNDSKSPSTYIYSVLFSYLTLAANIAFSVYIIKKSYKHQKQNA